MRYFSRNLLYTLIIAISLEVTKVKGQSANTTLPSLVCSGPHDCESCVLDSVCFWCESKLRCKVYDASNEEAQKKECGEVMWRSCKKPEKPGMAHIISAVVSVILIFGRYDRTNIQY